MNRLTFYIASISIVFLLVATGCDDNGTKSNTGTAAESQSGNHDHENESGHDHSVEGHTHAPGPHGGTIVDWGGGKYHVEFVVDHDNQKAMAYIFGPDEKTPTPIDAKNVTLTIQEPSITTLLKPSQQEGDPEGTASCFVGTDEGLAVVREFEGFMSAVIDGTPYSGNFAEEAHDH